jgi:hypothetical protein
MQVRVDSDSATLWSSGSTVGSRALHEPCGEQRPTSDSQENSGRGGPAPRPSRWRGAL